MGQESLPRTRMPLPQMAHPLACPTQALHRALAAERVLRGTHCGPQLHGCLVKVSWPGWVYQLLG